MNIPPSSFRHALPRVGISETSDLPVAILAARLAAAGERCAALEAYREVLEAAPNDRKALVAMSVILGRMGRDEEAQAVHERIAVIAVSEMGIAAEHQGAAIVFERATMGIGEVPAQMPRGYTAALFDGYAPHFDKNLRDDLGYRAPEHLQTSLSHALGALGMSAQRSLDMFDIGCGTGLLGPLLRGMARRLDGVDCSPRMLDQARALDLYDEFVEDDLTAALIQRPNQYDVVTAADVFVYIGDLAPVFMAVASSLRMGGLVAFTVEASEDEGVQLTSSGRYVHAPAFVREAATVAGLVEVSAEKVTLRREHSSFVEGFVWVFRKEGGRHP